jgi:diguanylate cyclase (GGDEF)-like protein
MKHSLATPGQSRSMAGLRQAVLDALPEALFLVDSASGQLRSLNSAAERWISSPSAGKRSTNLSELLPDFNLAGLATSISGFVLSHAVDPTTNAAREVMLHLYPLDDGQRELEILDASPTQEPWTSDAQQIVLGLRLIGSAISGQTAGDDETKHRDAFDDAFHDPLTRLPNRRLFQRRLERIIERASRSKCHFAVLFVDLDRFKSVNDQYGHTQGDKLLVAAAHRLVEAVRPQDMVARRDGDEFTILLNDLDRPEDAVGVAQRIIEHLQAPIVIDALETTDAEVISAAAQSVTVNIGASIGIATAADGLQTAEELTARADAAMYQAKARGGGVYWAQRPTSADQDNQLSNQKPRPR